MRSVYQIVINTDRSYCMLYWNKETTSLRMAWFHLLEPVPPFDPRRQFIDCFMEMVAAFRHAKNPIIKTDNSRFFSCYLFHTRLLIPVILCNCIVNQDLTFGNRIQ